MEAQKSNTIDRINAIRESKSKTKSYITFGVSLLISILLIVFALKPTISTIINIRSEIKEKEKVSSQLKSKIDALASLDEEYKDNKEKFEMLEFVYPEGEEFILLMSNMESVVARNGFELKSIGFDKYDGETYALAPNVLSPYSMRISVAGDYSDLLPLLRDLESLPNYSVLESLSFSSQKDDQGNGNYSILLRIYGVKLIYFYE